MKKKSILFFILFIIFIFRIDVLCEESEVDLVIDKMEELFNVDTSSGLMKQVITTTRNEEREFEILMFSKNGTDKEYMEYTYPERVKGIKFLYLNDGDDIWTFFPKTERLKKLARHHKKRKVMGSEFTYEDLSFGNVRKKFACTIVNEEKYEEEDCWVIEMIPTDDGPSYFKELMWVRKNDYYPVKVEYYEDEKTLLKTLYQKDIKKVQDIPTAFTIIMRTEETGAETRMEILKMEYHAEIDDVIFTTSYLEKE